MKAETLKKKYPDLWNSVHDGVIRDMRMLVLSHTVARNAAVNACFELELSHKTKQRRE